jgi:hypothetical protein
MIGEVRVWLGLFLVILAILVFHWIQDKRDKSEQLELNEIYNTVAKILEQEKEDKTLYGNGIEIYPVRGFLKSKWIIYGLAKSQIKRLVKMYEEKGFYCLSYYPDQCLNVDGEKHETDKGYIILQRPNFFQGRVFCPFFFANTREEEKRMRAIQKVIIIIYCILVAVACIYVPWKVDTKTRLDPNSFGSHQFSVLIYPRDEYGYSLFWKPVIFHEKIITPGDEYGISHTYSYYYSSSIDIKGIILELIAITAVFGIFFTLTLRPKKVLPGS